MRRVSVLPLRPHLAHAAFAPLVLAALGASLGCGRSHQSSPPTPTPSASDASLPSPGTPPPSGEPPACDEIQARFRATVDAATGRCTADTDCGCYNPVAPGLGCGGVTDRVSSVRLSAIETAFHAAHCRWPLACAAHLCQPKCDAGRCR